MNAASRPATGDWSGVTRATAPPHGTTISVDGPAGNCALRSQIASIINQRQDLQNAVAAVEAPQSFASSARLLRQSLTAAIADDLAIQGWLDAWLAYDSYTFSQFWQKHLDATAQATRDKQAFIEAYNRARQQVLKLGPLAIGDRY